MYLAIALPRHSAGRHDRATTEPDANDRRAGYGLLTCWFRGRLAHFMTIDIRLITLW